MLHTKPFFILFLLFFLFSILHLFSEDKNEKWVVYYTDEEDIRSFDPYELIVLDSHYHPSIDNLNERGKVLLGYISLGEVEDDRWWYEEVKEEGILREENEFWEGSYFVDLRDPKWSKRVIEELIPMLLNKHFDGIFIDTIDNAGFMEDQNPEKYKGMKQAAANLIKAIRYHYPNLKIMLNRGYDILPEVANSIDMVMGESLYTDYNFKTKEYQFVDKETYEMDRKSLLDAKKINPKLKVYSLDYWYPEDKETIKKIYRVERENGFIPYVSTIELDKIISEPE